MTRVLALDTSTWWGGVALLESDGTAQGSRVVAEIGVQVDKSHSARILGWIGALLDEAGWSRDGLDLVVATRGPGSFTGIRVGLGTVRGLALAAGIPCVGVGTLEALAAAHGPARTPRMPLIDAGRGQFYGALYDAETCPPVELDAPWVDEPSRGLGVEGPAATVVPGWGTDLDPATLAPRLQLAPIPRGLAAAAARVAAVRSAAGVPGEACPLYLRPPDALFRRQVP